jgi:polysaccharide export outer membrane protein
MTRVVCWLPLAFAVLLAPGAAAQGPAPDQPTITPAVVLQPGDAIRIAVWRRPEFSGEFTVTGDGSLAHPLYRSVGVAGVPVGTVEERLRAFLGQFDAEPQFVMEPLVRVAVGGEVDRPDVYLVRPELTVAEAVAIAGGATERGRRDRVRIERNGLSRVLHLTGPDASESRTRVQSGDLLMNEGRRAVFRDVIAPVLGVAGAAAAILNVILRAGQ